VTVAPPTKKRISPKVDLSGLTDEQKHMRLRVIRLGEISCGIRWMSDFAALLTEEARRPVRYVQVSQWVTGYRPVPEALAEPLERLALKVADQLVQQADTLRADWAKSTPADDTEPLGSLAPRA
jgi:hypothetical protein